ncbi:MAG: hypothetical protein U1C55_09415, partial [Smithellaceae bacterium]|nr:hypothetical protein [Smithellaceae bacterium]
TMPGNVWHFASSLNNLFGSGFLPPPSKGDLRKGTARFLPLQRQRHKSLADRKEEQDVHKRLIFVFAIPQ